MTTTELIELLKKHERGGATGRLREVMFEVDDRIIDTDGIEVTGSGDGLISELYLSLPSAQPVDKDINVPANDLISRQAAISAIKEWGLLDGLSEGQAIEILADEEKVPSAQPERKKGKWIKLYTGNYKCSECGDWWGNDDNNMIENFHYCPNCGADMRGTE